jgi:flagellar hook-associated protein 2
VGGTSIPGFSGAPTLSQASSDVNSPGFTGLSSYSSDLQNAMNRSVALASLPLHLLQNEQSLLTSQSTALSALNLQFSGLRSAISSLNSASQNLLSASVSDQTILNANVAAGALTGTYSVTVTDPGSFSSVLSNSATPVTDPATQNISSALSFTLSLNGVAQQPPITPAANNLNSLAAAINAANEGVQAAIVNIGPPNAPNYQLSLQSTQLGNITIQLSDGSNLMGNLTPGAPAQYQVNGAPASPISSTTDTVTIAPGVTVTLLQKGTSTITVSQTASAVSNALSSFASAYNSAADELSKSRGQDAGALSGQGVVSSLTMSLRQLSNYTGTGGSITSLTDLGLTFDTNGHLNFDPTVLSSIRGPQLADLTSFLGGATGGGFLQFATNLMAGIEDANTGLLPTAISSTAGEIAHENQLIANRQNSLTQLQTSLQEQMSKADALISQIESRNSYFTTLFQSMLFPPNQVR